MDRLIVAAMAPLLILAPTLDAAPAPGPTASAWDDVRGPHVAAAFAVAAALRDVPDDRYDAAGLLVEAATTWQLDSLSLEPVLAPAPSSAGVAAALESLAYQTGAPWGQTEALEAARLDALPAPVPDAFTRTIDAFTALDATARARPGDLAAIAPARAVFAKEAIALGRLVGALTHEVRLATAEVNIPPTFATDVTGIDSLYTLDLDLILDFGGNDRYFNNAGGKGPPASFGCNAWVPPPGAGAVYDEDGDDQYGDPAIPVVPRRDCGLNGGGGGGGVGSILDLGGHDRYSGGDHGTNGAGSVGGVGFLLDVSGNDVYSGGDQGTNGASHLGSGLLVDGGGRDTYTGIQAGVNGGGDVGGDGFLLDVGGRDSYSGGLAAVNGGAGAGATGHLVDLAGDDTYTATERAVNGGAFIAGVGLLFDLRGNDTYSGTDTGVNGGGVTGGLGTLIDLAGDDRYTALGGLGVNGGGGTCGPECLPSVLPNAGVGLLLDTGGGRDTYSDGQGGSGVDRTVLFKGVWGFQIDRAQVCVAPPFVPCV